MSKNRIVIIVTFVAAALVLPQPSGAIVGDPVPTDVPVPHAYVPVPDVLPVESLLAEGSLPESCLVDGMAGCPEAVWCHDHEEQADEPDCGVDMGGGVSVTYCNLTSTTTETVTVGISWGGVLTVSTTYTRCHYSGCGLTLTEDEANSAKH